MIKQWHWLWQNKENRAVTFGNSCAILARCDCQHSKFKFFQPMDICTGYLLYTFNSPLLLDILKSRVRFFKSLIFRCLLNRYTFPSLVFIYLCNENKKLYNLHKFLFRSYQPGYCISKLSWKWKCICRFLWYLALVKK